MEKQTTFAQAILEAQDVALHIDPSVILYGLGVPDPKGVFGTTQDLHKKYGSERVFDMPTAENGMLGVGIGAAMTGLRPVMVSQRLDFFLLAMDQLVNNAAKWHYMFGGKASIPITIRLILGRGWGQGPTHSQNFQSWFAHIPGLKVVMPATPADAKGLLLASIFDNNPVVFLEHRWLHNQVGHVPEGDYRVELGQPQQLHTGADLTIVSMSYMTIDALHTVRTLQDLGVTCDLIDLRTISPLDMSTIYSSVKKTGRLLCLDTGHYSCSVASHIVAQCARECWHSLRAAPQIIALPDVPTPTSPALAAEFYPHVGDILKRIAMMLDRPLDWSHITLPPASDVPGTWFKGPF